MRALIALGTAFLRQGQASSVLTLPLLVAAMRDSLTLKEVAILLPAIGAGAKLLELADTLHVRAGHAQQCLFRLKDLGAARVVWDDATGSSWWRVDGIVIPDLVIRSGATAKKPDAGAGAGNVGLHDGGIAAKKRDQQPLVLYGENKDRPRAKLADIQAVAKVKAARAKDYAAVAFTRAADDAKANAAQLIGVLAVEADALADAGEMVRARIERLTKESLAKPSFETGAAAPSSG